MSDIKTENEPVESKKPNKRFKLKVIFQKKKIIIVLSLLLLLSPLFYGFLKGTIHNLQIQNAHQGELIYYIINENEIKDSDLTDWVNETHKTKGIHVYNGQKPSDGKYILLATGEQPIQNIDIIMESVIGYKDKILINGKVIPPKLNIEKSPSFPYELIRIETKNDPREVQLGTMNLYDVFRGIQEPIRISLDNAIVKEINGETIKLLVFKQKNHHPRYVLAEKALTEIKVQDIKDGDIVSVNLNNDMSQEYPKVENIRKTTRATEKIQIEKVSEDNQVVNAKINNISIMFRYKSEIKDKVNLVKPNNDYLVKLEKVGDIIYITDIFGL